MNRVFVIICLFVSLLFFHHPAYAARARTRVQRSGSASTAVTYSTAKLSRSTHSVIVTLLHLDRVSSVTYTLSYTANGVSQGAMGSIAPSGNLTDSRDLYFGTCSHGVCTPHYNISGATLLVESTLKAGGTNTKRYKIKI